MYTDKDKLRLYIENGYILAPESYRSEFYRDYARIIHSPCFRRLQGKTQLFPSHESDFFRNRLTHSLEVAQIGKAITNRVNYLIVKNYSKQGANNNSLIDADLVQFACLSHDLGHPPFGHQGESELDEIMKDHGGFEGNAQTLRILTKMEKREKAKDTNKYGFTDNGVDQRFGLNLSLRSLASVIKYDYPIPNLFNQRLEDNKNGLNPTGKVKPAKGYYLSEKEIVNEIKNQLFGTLDKPVKTVEMQIMDIADDIAYSTYDFEDSLKGGFINALDLVTIEKEMLEKITNDVNIKFKSNFTVDKTKEIIFELFADIISGFEFEGDDQALLDLFKDGTITSLVSAFVYTNNKDYANNGYYRNALTSRWVGRFVRSVNIKYNSENPILSTVYIDDELKESDHSTKEVSLKIEVLKRFTYEFQISSNKLKIAESRGRGIIKTIFTKIEESEGDFLPQDYSSVYKLIKEKVGDVQERNRMLKRTICDFIASMTDPYCIEFFGRLTSENPQSIFKAV